MLQRPIRLPKTKGLPLGPRFVYWHTSTFQPLGKNIRQGMRNYTKNAARQLLEA